MSNAEEFSFFERPIINSPYQMPKQHWRLDEEGQPTGQVNDFRRIPRFVTAIPKPKKSKKVEVQDEFVFQDDAGISSGDQQYTLSEHILNIRSQVDAWRNLPKSDWRVTPETARLLEYWRKADWDGYRPFFCQVEAVETAIWLQEVAPQLKNDASKRILNHLKQGNQDANPNLFRIAMKLATGSGKTTVMAMLIAWQTINSIRRRDSKKFTHGFLIVTPGITIKDRLRVLLPNDPDSYFLTRSIVPTEMLPDLQKARIVVTNYHAFKRREILELSKANRSLLQGTGDPIESTESDGQMLKRVIPDLLGMKSIIVLNDEAHHCYRAKPESVEDTSSLDPEQRKELREEAKKNNEAARLWISGLELIQKNLGITNVYDLSATPFFLRGSGYVEGTLFPWTVSDFSLIDAIECGIVKLPRVPILDNLPGEEIPLYRNLWENIRKDMPKKGRGNAGELDPLRLPVRLQTALESLYGHYEKVYAEWEKAGTQVPPCFIVVCQNTSISKLVYDYISGFFQKTESGIESLQNGRLKLFRNFTEDGEPFASPRTILIDSEALESGESIDKEFRNFAKDEIERFRRELIERTGNPSAGENIKDEDLLREVMNTVGKAGQLGANVRCVVSVSMLTEGWDANNVTHILGVRAFGTQLLCEQVVGRALRRQSYEMLEDGLFSPEYADIFGIPFDFTATPAIAKPKPPVDPIIVQAMRPERDALEIQFPRVSGYRTELSPEKIQAKFTEESKFVLTPELVGATKTKNSGIIGQQEDMNLEDSHLDLRTSTVYYFITKHLLYHFYKDTGDTPKLHLFNPLKEVVREWVENYLECKNGTSPGQLQYLELADIAAQKIQRAITFAQEGKKPIQAILDPYNPVGSTSHVRFMTTAKNRFTTDPRKSHINYVIYDSDWEAEFCRVLESHPKVIAYVKNHGLGFEVPYKFGSFNRTYFPDFIVLIANGEEGPIRLVVEIKGFKREDAREKKGTMEIYWIPGVNNLQEFGRWEFLELTGVHDMDPDLNQKIHEMLDTKVQSWG
jgi:type III restriction enzyme